MTDIHRHKYTHTDRQTDRQTNRQTDKSVVLLAGATRSHHTPIYLNSGRIDYNGVDIVATPAKCAENTLHASAVWLYASYTGWAKK